MSRLHNWRGWEGWGGKEEGEGEKPELRVGKIRWTKAVPTWGLAGRFLARSGWNWAPYHHESCLMGRGTWHLSSWGFWVQNFLSRKIVKDLEWLKRLLCGGKNYCVSLQVISESYYRSVIFQLRQLIIMEIIFVHKMWSCLVKTQLTLPSDYCPVVY